MSLASPCRQNKNPPKSRILDGASSSAWGEAESWYRATGNGRQPCARLEGHRRHDVAVIGAGFTGLTVALELAQKGFDVAVIEAREVGWGASGRNGGQVVTGFLKSLREIRDHMGPDDALRLWRMAEEGKTIVHDRIRRYAIACDYQPGYMYTAVKPRHVAWLRDLLESWQEAGYQGAHWLDAEQTRAQVDSPYYLGGIKDEENGHLHPLNYCRGLAAAALREGATIYEHSEVVLVETAGNPRVDTENGSIACNHVVLAGNALLGALSPEIARIVNAQIVPVSTYIIATERMDPARAEAIIPGNIAVSDMMFVVNYYRRTSDHRLLFGGGLDWSGMAIGNIARRMRSAMYKWLPQSRGLAVDYCWGGLVDMTASRLPSLGRLSPNVTYVHGFSGNGITLTGIAGRVTAEAVAGTLERFDVFARLPKTLFPGGTALRTPLAVAAALWYKMKDILP